MNGYKRSNKLLKRFIKKEAFKCHAQLRDTLGTIYTDEAFADLFPTQVLSELKQHLGTESGFCYSSPDEENGNGMVVPV